MVEDITVEQFVSMLAEGSVTPVDVRSPFEFSEGAMPGSVNVPLFNNEERREIGIIYKQHSVEKAKDRGLEIVSAKLPAFIRELQAIPGRKAVFCWRGGMRSKTAATLLSILEPKVYRIQGGIRAYRRWVAQTLDTFDWKLNLIVLNGFTGTGKTQILRSLHEKGYPVLDLEKLAGHRGSIFGGVGQVPHNQRTFDALLVHELIRLRNRPYILMEAESRRIGKVVMPDGLVELKQKAPQLVIELPVPARVKQIISEYDPEHHAVDCMEAFSRIERKIHTPAAKIIREALQSGEYGCAVNQLLEYYYDPQYRHSIHEFNGERVTITASTVKAAEAKIEAYLKRTTLRKASG